MDKRRKSEPRPFRILKHSLFEEASRPIGGLYFLNWRSTGIWVEDASAMESIYAFACDGFVKIGRARDWRKRLVGLQGGCPLILRRLYTFSVPSVGAAYAEYYAQEHMAEIARPIHGEWFACGEDAHPKINGILKRAQRRGQVYADHYREWKAQQEEASDELRRQHAARHAAE